MNAQVIVNNLIEAPVGDWPAFQQAMAQATQEFMGKHQVYGGGRPAARPIADPYDINCGLCEEWGERVRQLYQEATGQDDVEVLDPGNLSGNADDSLAGHVFLRFNGKFYDAECQDGVLHVGALPLFKKQIGEAREPLDVLLMMRADGRYVIQYDEGRFRITDHNDTRGYTHAEAMVKAEAIKQAHALGRKLGEALEAGPDDPFEMRPTDDPEMQRIKKRLKRLKAEKIAAQQPDTQALDDPEAFLKGEVARRAEPIKKLEIVGRRWYRRGPGGVYCKAYIYINDRLVHVTPEQYGYGDHYLTLATDWLKRNGYIDLDDRTPLWHLRDRGDFELSYYAVDVKRERDL